MYAREGCLRIFSAHKANRSQQTNINVFVIGYIMYKRLINAYSLRFSTSWESLACTHLTKIETLKRQTSAESTFG